MECKECGKELEPIATTSPFYFVLQLDYPKLKGQVFHCPDFKCKGHSILIGEKGNRYRITSGNIRGEKI